MIRQGEVYAVHDHGYSVLIRHSPSWAGNVTTAWGTISDRKRVVGAGFPERSQLNSVLPSRRIVGVSIIESLGIDWRLWAPYSNDADYSSIRDVTRTPLLLWFLSIQPCLRRDRGFN